MPAVAGDRSTRDTVAQRAPLAGVLLIAAGASLWGLDALLRKPLTNEWSPYTIVLYEHAILTLAVAPILIRYRAQIRRLTRAGWASAIVIGWGGSALATLFITLAFAIGYANPDVILLLQKTQPLWAIAAAALVLGERPRREMAWLLVPAAIGTYLLSFGLKSPSEVASGGHLRPVLYSLAAAALWGSATAFGRRGLREVDPNVLMALRFSLALPFLAVIAATEHAMLPAHHAVAGDWLRLPLLALGSGLVAMMLYYRGLRTTPAPLATIAELAFPATALVVNRIAFGTTINGWQMAGFAVLWATIALIYRVPVSVPRGREVAMPPPLPSNA
jgi:drug/metabolite transporter (DMT)-like permease